MNENSKAGNNELKQAIEFCKTKGAADSGGNSIYIHHFVFTFMSHIKILYYTKKI